MTPGYGNDTGGRFIGVCSKIRTSLLAFGVCGLAGVLVDLDHPAAFLLGIRHSRFLHIPIFVICCCVLWYLIAYRRRLLGKMVLAVDPVRKGKKVRLDGQDRWLV